jgi:hypothetical protein
MGYGVSQYFPVTFTSGASISSDIALAGGFTKVYINVAGATNSVHFQAAPSVLGSPGTYALVKYAVASGLSAPQTATVGTAASGSWVEVPLAGFPYIKVVNVGGAADGATLKILGFNG